MRNYHGVVRPDPDEIPLVVILIDGGQFPSGQTITHTCIHKDSLVEEMVKYGAHRDRLTEWLDHQHTEQSNAIIFDLDKMQADGFFFPDQN